MLQSCILIFLNLRHHLLLLWSYLLNRCNLVIEVEVRRHIPIFAALEIDGIEVLRILIDQWTELRQVMSVVYYLPLT